MINNCGISNLFDGKVKQNFSNKKMRSSHFVTNGTIMLTNAPIIKTKNLRQNPSPAKKNTKFSSRNQKKCNNPIQPIDYCRIFAFQERIKKVVYAHSDL